TAPRRLSPESEFRPTRLGAPMRAVEERLSGRRAEERVQKIAAQTASANKRSDLARRWKATPEAVETLMWRTYKTRSHYESAIVILTWQCCPFAEETTCGASGCQNPWVLLPMGA